MIREGLRRWLTKRLPPSMIPSMTADVVKDQMQVAEPTAYERKTAHNRQIFEQLGGES